MFGGIWPCLYEMMPRQFLVSLRLPRTRPAPAVNTSNTDLVNAIPFHVPTTSLYRAMSSSFVNPSSISESGPSRKRPRSDVSSEERKEARAHRNRIAAQNSRDRRKAQFCQLERRVQELEEENRQLRAGFGLAQAPTPSKSPEEAARDRENEELKERIKTLEKGWDAVVKALAAQGLPGKFLRGSHWHLLTVHRTSCTRFNTYINHININTATTTALYIGIKTSDP